jgi:small subunit ribosomal protein S9
VPEKRYYATGKRKTAVARVWIMQGAGQYRINGRVLEDYFPLEEWRLMVNKPFAITENMDKFDIVANIYGGGIPAQAWALGHGIAKALLEFNSGLRGLLKKQGLITRDPRVKERKKYGKKAARASFQPSRHPYCPHYVEHPSGEKDLRSVSAIPGETGDPSRGDRRRPSGRVRCLFPLSAPRCFRNAGKSPF